MFDSEKSSVAAASPLLGGTMREAHTCASSAAFLSLVLRALHSVSVAVVSLEVEDDAAT